MYQKEAEMIKNFGNINNSRTVVYPPVGIAHITDNLSDLIETETRKASAINIHSSAQPNSYPHLGSITTIMTGFALGKHFKDSFNLPVTLKFEYDNNSPAEKIEADGVTYSKMQIQNKIEGVRRDKHFINEFEYLFSYLEKKAGISRVARTFEEFQCVPFVREKLIEIIKNDEFRHIVGPSERKFHIRFPCPHCGYADKSGVFLHYTIKDNGLHLKSKCFEHGEIDLLLTPNNRAFIDFNTPLMDIIQGSLFIEEDSQENAVCIMFDGGDWSGVWASDILGQGLSSLGYKYEQFPLHFYAPIIEDWSGAKFSKSMYIEGNDYNHIPEELLNLRKFRETYGDKGLDVIWEEVSDWVADPKKFFRNYTLDYFISAFSKRGLI